MIIPEDNPLTVEGVQLGEKLFNDPILSADNTLSCSGCHIKANSFSENNQYSTGIDNIEGFRNASALINLGWNTSFNWEGGAISLEEQAFEPVTNPIEMHETWWNVESKLNSDSVYRFLFKNAFDIDFIVLEERAKQVRENIEFQAFLVRQVPRLISISASESLSLYVKLSNPIIELITLINFLTT